MLQKMQVWQLRHFRIHDALSFKTVDSWKVHLKIDTIFNSSSIAPGDIPISESISLFAIPTKVAMVSIRTGVHSSQALRWHVSACPCGIYCSLSWHSFVICYKTPETINKYRMLGVSWGTNFLSELFDLFLSLVLVSGVTYRVNYNLIKVGPLIPRSMLSAVTIIVMLTDICRAGQRTSSNKTHDIYYFCTWYFYT